MSSTSVKSEASYKGKDLVHTNVKLAQQKFIRVGQFTQIHPDEDSVTG